MWTMNDCEVSGTVVAAELATLAQRNTIVTASRVLGFGEPLGTDLQLLRCVQLEGDKTLFLTIAPVREGHHGHGHATLMSSARYCCSYWRRGTSAVVKRCIACCSLEFQHHSTFLHSEVQTLGSTLVDREKQYLGLSKPLTAWLLLLPLPSPLLPL